MYLYSATSFGLTSNTFPDISADPTVEQPIIIFDELAVRGVSFNWYEDQQPGHGSAAPAPDIVLTITAAKRYGRNPVVPFTQFLSDAKNGTLPQVSFIDGDNTNETPTGNDEHPPSEIEIGQDFVWQVVNAVTTSPEWKNTVLFIAYDENGGIYDHVVPPAACKPDSLEPVLTTTLDKSQPGQFDQYGFRVPVRCGLAVLEEVVRRSRRLLAHEHHPASSRRSSSCRRSPRATRTPTRSRTSSTGRTRPS